MNFFFILVHAFDNAKWPFKESWFYSHYTDGVNEAAHIDELDEPEKCLLWNYFLALTCERIFCEILSHKKVNL